MRWLRDLQTCLAVSLLKSYRACSGTRLRDWIGSSDMVESTLLNDKSETFYYLRGAEIRGGGITFCTPICEISHSTRGEFNHQFNGHRICNVDFSSWKQQNWKKSREIELSNKRNGIVLREFDLVWFVQGCVVTQPIALRPDTNSRWLFISRWKSLEILHLTSFYSSWFRILLCLAFLSIQWRVSQLTPGRWGCDSVHTNSPDSWTLHE
jgi:hypothetical protein